MALRKCSASHCSGVDQELNEVCKQEGWAVGHPVITRDKDGPCQCHCSCVALGTPVANDINSFCEIQHFAVGDFVMTAGADLKWNKIKVAFSNGTTSGIQPITVFLTYEGGELVITPDHLFLTPLGLIRADRLTSKDVLTSPDGKHVRIFSVEIGSFSGGFHHIATSTEDPKGDLSNHLLNMNGVVCADYALQLFHTDEAALLDSNFKKHLERPVVGSCAYEKENSTDSALQSGSAHKMASINSLKVGEGLFTPKRNIGTKIPPDAVSFISDEEAKRIKEQTSNFRAMTDSDSQAWAEYLLKQYKAFYPEVTYHLEWYDENVNAYAWNDNGNKHVAILGGLVRHPSLFIEGIAIVVAHELGHHYGGDPKYPNSVMACEGQADYYGVANIMRNVWFGEYYITVATRGIKQMAKFFGVKEPGSNKGQAGCNHPKGECRIHTYNAAVDIKAKPSCAG